MRAGADLRIIKSVGCTVAEYANARDYHESKRCQSRGLGARLPYVLLRDRQAAPRGARWACRVGQLELQGT